MQLHRWNFIFKHGPCVQQIQLIILILFLFTSLFTRAEDLNCGSIDLRTAEMGYPFHQGPSFWCYAVAASDLITQAVGTKASPLYIALNSIKKTPAFDKIEKAIIFGDHTKGGSVIDAIQSLNGRVCKNEYMPANSMEIEEGLLLIEKTNGLTDFDNTFNDSCRASDNKTLSTLFPRANLTELFKTVALENINQMWADLNREGCLNDKLKIDNLRAKIEIKNRFKDEQPELIARLNGILDKKRIVAIQYDPSFFSKYTNIDFTDPIRKSRHTSTVVARKEINGKCKYLIRESYGPSCSLFKESYCDKENPGNVWVTFEELAKNTQSITYIDPD